MNRYDTPWIVCSGQCSRRRRSDAVAAHMDLLGFGEGLAVGAVVDDVVARDTSVYGHKGSSPGGVIRGSAVFVLVTA